MENFINQERARSMIRSSLDSGRLAHAYLFSGPEGSGKYAAAIELAQAVNCESAAGRPCGVCPSCVRTASLSHPDLNLVFPLPVGDNEKEGDHPLDRLTEEEVSLYHEQIALKAKNPYHRISLPGAGTIKLSSIRELRRESSLSTVEARKKIFVILDADAMNEESANALLKTLEEPHEDTLLILTTSRPAALLPTLSSRCQHIRFDPLPENAIARALEEREGIEAPTARTIARLSGGSYSRALAYSSAPLGESREEALGILRTVLLKSRAEILAETDRLSRDYEKHEIVELLHLLENSLRDAMVIAGNAGTPSDDPGADPIRKLASLYPAADYPLAVEAIDRAISLLGKNVYIRLIILNLACSLKHSIDPL